MSPPFIAPDGCYSVHVLWLDPVDLDRAVKNPLDKRYILNKRSSDVHGKGWESVPAASLDSWVDTIWDGAHVRISNTHKNEIVSRQQSWLLLARNQGASLGQEPLPQVIKPNKLRPGQSKEPLPQVIKPNKLRPGQSKKVPVLKRRRSPDSDSEPLVAKRKANAFANRMTRQTGKRKSSAHKHATSGERSSGLNHQRKPSAHKHATSSDSSSG
jgi:hypothetical protein